jgi:hypothetical protein
MLFEILSLTQLYRYTPEIFFFSTATFKYIYRAPLRRIGPEYPAREFRMHMKNPAQTGSGCICFNDLNFHHATFAEYSCPIRLRGPGSYI